MKTSATEVMIPTKRVTPRALSSAASIAAWSCGGNNRGAAGLTICGGRHPAGGATVGGRGV